MTYLNHIPKLNITFPSEILVSSDKRNYRNMTFQSVLARQGSFFFCKRARLNFQAFATRDINMAAREGCHVRSKDELSLSFLLTKQCLQ